MGNVDSGGGCACMGAGILWETSAPFPQLCCELKSALKYSLNKKKRKKTKQPAQYGISQ